MSERAGRGQSHVVGVALLLCVSVIALGVVAAGVGSVVGETAANANAMRVADTLADAFAPTGPTGHESVRVPASAGRLRTAARDVRVLDANGTVRRYRTNAVIFETGERGVTSVAGAIVVRDQGWARVTRPVRATATSDALVLDVVVVDGELDVSGRGPGIRIRTNATETRDALAGGTYRLAVETSTPEAFARYYERHASGGRVLGERDYDGDGVSSVVIGFPPAARAYVLTHDVEVAV